jgi:hypothetical protein
MRPLLFLFLSSLFLTACNPQTKELWRWNKGKFELFTPTQAMLQKSVVLAYDPECPVCLLYNTDISYLYQTYENVNWYMIAPMGADTALLMDKFAVEYQSSPRFTLLYDPNNHFLKKTGFHTTPQVMVFGPNGSRIYDGKIDNRVKGLGIKSANADSFFLGEALRAMYHNRLPSIQKTTPIGCIIQ